MCPAKWEQGRWGKVEVPPPPPVSATLECDTKRLLLSPPAERDIFFLIFLIRKLGPGVHFESMKTTVRQIGAAVPVHQVSSSLPSKESVCVKPLCI